MVILIICLVIMQKRYTNHPVNLGKYPHLPLELRLWLALPYPVRLRIEHYLFVCNKVINLGPKVDMKVLRRLRMKWYRKMSVYYLGLLNLKEKWYDSMPNRSFSYSDSPEMKRFLESAKYRFTNFNK